MMVHLFTDNSPRYRHLSWIWTPSNAWGIRMDLWSSGLPSCLGDDRRVRGRSPLPFAQGRQICTGILGLSLGLVLGFTPARAEDLSPGVQSGSVQFGSLQSGNLRSASLQPASLQSGNLRSASLQPASLQPASVRSGTLNPDGLLVSGGAANPDPVIQLQGHWQWQSPDGTRMILTFTEPDRLVLQVQSPNPDGTGSNSLQLLEELRYTIQTDADPMALDLTLADNQQIQTIFKLETPDRLLLELSQLSPGQPRPTAFGDATLTFERLDTPPPLPDSLTLVPYETRQQQQQEAQAQAYLQALTQAQTAYYQGQGTFASQWDDFVVGLDAETPAYTYGVLVLPDLGEIPTAGALPPHQGVLITAQAQGEGIHSYGGLLVAVEPAPGDLQFLWQACASPQPSPKLPPLPRVEVTAALPDPSPEDPGSQTPSSLILTPRSTADPTSLQALEPAATPPQFPTMVILSCAPGSLPLEFSP